MVDMTELRHEESVGLEAERLAELYAQLGDVGAQDVVCRAMEELAVRLTRLKAAYFEKDFRRLAKSAKGLIAIAEQVGMNSLARVAGDVRHCAGKNDPVALAATVARLLRIGDRSLMAVWDLQDLSI